MLQCVERVSPHEYQNNDPMLRRSQRVLRCIVRGQDTAIQECCERKISMVAAKTELNHTGSSIKNTRVNHRCSISDKEQYDTEVTQPQPQPQ